MIIKMQDAEGFVIIGEGMGVYESCGSVMCAGIQQYDGEGGFDLILGDYFERECALFIIDEIYEALINGQNYEMPGIDDTLNRMNSQTTKRINSWQGEKEKEKIIKNKSSDLYEKLSVKTANALIRAGYLSFSDVLNADPLRLIEGRGLGEKAAQELRENGVSL